MRVYLLTKNKVFVLAICWLLFAVMRLFLNNHNVSLNTIFEDELDLRRSEMSIFEYDMALRRNIMQKACKAHGLDVRGEDALHQPNAWEYIISKHNDTNLVWCPVFKSGSTR